MQHFLPSEFSMDPSQMGHALELGRVTFDEKMEIRKAIEEANISHTYVSVSFFAGYSCPNHCQMRTLLPPKEKFHVYGVGARIGYQTKTFTGGGGTCKSGHLLTGGYRMKFFKKN